MQTTTQTNTHATQRTNKFHPIGTLFVKCFPQKAKGCYYICFGWDTHFTQRNAIAYDTACNITERMYLDICDKFQAHCNAECVVDVTADGTYKVLSKLFAAQQQQ